MAVSFIRHDTKNDKKELHFWQFIHNTGQLSKYVRNGYLFSIKGFRQGYVFRQNGKQKYERLDFGAEPPRIELCKVPPPPPPPGFNLLR